MTDYDKGITGYACRRHLNTFQKIDCQARCPTPTATISLLQSVQLPVLARILAGFGWVWLHLVLIPKHPSQLHTAYVPSKIGPAMVSTNDQAADTHWEHRQEQKNSILKWKPLERRETEQVWARNEPAREGNSRFEGFSGQDDLQFTYSLIPARTRSRHWQ